MGQKRAERRWRDDCERGADAELDAHVFGHTEHAKNIIEDGHDDGSAADAENARQQPRHDAAEDDGASKQDEFAEGYA
jgi:hypothetical protein